MKKLPVAVSIAKRRNPRSAVWGKNKKEEKKIIINKNVPKVLNY